MKNLILLLLSALILAFCSQRLDPAVAFVDVNGTQIPKIKPELIEDHIEVKFTDWYENIRMVELELTENSAIQYVTRKHVGEEYIIISTRRLGILMFSPQGKFIRVIAPYGNGLGEVKDPNREIFVDEKNNKVYITDSDLHRDKALCVGIYSGLVEYIPFQNTGGEFTIREIIAVADSIMICTTMQMRGLESSCPVFSQTTSGQLLWEIYMVHPLGITDGGIRQVGDDIFFHYYFVTDTIYRLEGQKLQPVVIISTDKQRGYLEKKVGNISLGMYPITPTLFRGGFSYITEVKTDERSGRDRELYSEGQDFVYNTESNEATLIGEIQNDYLGFNEKFYLQQTNKKGVVSYQAVDLIEKVDSIYHRPDITPELKSRLGKILETLDENDNPWLMIGDWKGKS